MNLVENIIQYMQSKYGVDLTNNVFLMDNGQRLVLLTNADFDWCTEGLIVYNVKFEGIKNTQYQSSGFSNVYDDEHSKPVRLYVIKDLNDIIKKYFANYYLVDVDSSDDDNRVGYIDFVFNHRAQLIR